MQLGTLVVKIAAEMRRYKADLDAVVQDTKAYNTNLATMLEPVSAQQEALNAATAAQAASAEAARAAQLAYVSSLQDFTIDAGKSVSKLGKLREETMKYYEAQKKLADLMTNSAAGLREAIRTTRMGQLDSSQSLAQRKLDFSKNYSLALSTDGATKASYADKMAAALPDLSAALMDTASTRGEWALATAKLMAQSTNIAEQLEATAPKDYQAESLELLQSIDATLAALETSTKSAERIVADAVAAGSDRTAAGLRAVIAALSGQAVPAFALGGDHFGGLRIVGEHGPELEATGPSRIFNATQTRAMLSGNTASARDPEVAQLLREVLAEMHGLRSETRATAMHGSKLVKIFSRVTVEGDAIRMVPA